MFISQAGLALTALPFSTFAADLTKLQMPRKPEYAMMGKDTALVDDEKYWKTVRSMFNFPKDFTNLENGYFSPQPHSTKQFHQSKEHDINQRSSWFMRKEQSEAIEKARKDLAEFLGFPEEELAITRNTTESLNTVISGYPWTKGDEVIIGNQDYGSMVSAFNQQVKRAGIIIKKAEVPLLPANDDEVVQAYTSLITPKTRVLHLTHMINLSGQLLPASKIIEAAHTRGIEVMVDAAHSVAHIDFKPGDLNADYFAASLHKWLCCPLGLGFLAVKKKQISKIWPLMADDEYAIDHIKKFEHQGTRPIQSIMSISQAIKFHNAIGSRLKQDRLRFLEQYWVNQVKHLEKVKMNTPGDTTRHGAIANISIANYSPAQLAEKLYSDFKIFTVAIDHPHIQGVRITPHLYTSLEDLEKLVEAIKKC